MNQLDEFIEKWCQWTCDKQARIDMESDLLNLMKEVISEDRRQIFEAIAMQVWEMRTVI